MDRDCLDTCRSKINAFEIQQCKLCKRYRYTIYRFPIYRERSNNGRKPRGVEATRHFIWSLSLYLVIIVYIIYILKAHLGHRSILKIKFMR